MHRHNLSKLALFTRPICLLLCFLPAISRAVPQLAEPPRVYMDTTFPTNSGRTVGVSTSAQLSAALADARCGDTIVLQAGAAFTGRFDLRDAGDCNGNWIILRSSALAKLPAQNRRVKPVDAGNMPKLIGANNEPTVQCRGGANYYWLAGLEVAHGAPPETLVFNIMMMGANYDVSTLDDIPHHIVIDRSYIHGESNTNIGHVSMDYMKHGALVDSYLADIHMTAFEVQGFVGCVGPGPYKVVNNYIEAAGENLFFGGCKTALGGLHPEDIEARHNYLFKPTRWKLGASDYAGIRWLVKNSFELKRARRVLFEGNIIENNWVHGQTGRAIVFTPRSGSQGGPDAVIEDVTFRRNILRHSANGFVITGHDDIDKTLDPLLLQTRRILIQDNIFEDIDSARWGGTEGGTTYEAGWAKDVVIDHNTSFNSGPFVVVSGSLKMENFTFTNNIQYYNRYGFFGDTVGSGTVALDTYASAYTFSKNVMLLNRYDPADYYSKPEFIAPRYPAGNFFPISLNEISFTNVNNGIGGDYTLTPASPYKNGGTDGKDIGADIATVMTATRGAVSGVWDGSDTVPPTAPKTLRTLP